MLAWLLCSVLVEYLIISWNNLLDSYFSILIVSLASLKFLEIKICGKLPLLYLIKVSILILLAIIFFISLMLIGFLFFNINDSYKSAIHPINDWLLLFSTP